MICRLCEQTSPLRDEDAKLGFVEALNRRMISRDRKTNPASPRLRRPHISILAFIGALVLVVTFTPLVRWWAIQLAGPWDDPGGETLIVLAGSGGGDGVIGYGTYLRCQYAVFAWRQGGFRKLVVSGGPPEHPQANAMKNFLVSQGVPESAIVTEGRSHSTRENAEFSKSAFTSTDGNRVLMTSDFHMYRAVRVFRKSGITVLPRPIPDASKRSSSWLGRWPAFLDLCVETVKIGYYSAKGWI
jgi:uncharacterized SAM-binding protein YcdF (DUF218 family)